MASGLIYLIIVGMWVAYFVPRWMTTHDEATGRSAERYKSAMKLVAEKDRPSFTPEVIDPEKKKKVITRRRNVLGSLLVVTLITAIVVAFGVVTYLAIFVPLSATLIYLVNVRRQVVAEQLRARRLRALEQITGAQIQLEPTERISLSRKPIEQPATWIPLETPLESATVTVIRTEDKTWQPVSVPRPTYVTAPKAITPKRIVDPILQSEIFPTRDEIFDQELEEQAAVMNEEFTRTKAVND